MNQQGIKSPHYTIVPNGDASLLIYFNDHSEASVREDTLQWVSAFMVWIDSHASATGEFDIIECVPGYHSVMINFDLLKTDFFSLKKQLLPVLEALSIQQLPELPVVHIPVCYHDTLGLDLPALAAHCELTVQEVIDRHTSADYIVYMLGFMPGFLYLGGLDPSLCMPRKDTPRKCIAQGAVGIAGQQTGIYPLASPGGWQIIGQTPLSLFDQHRKPPTLAQPLQHVRFYEISLEAFEQWGDV